MNTQVNSSNGKDAPKPSRLTLWRAERKLASARAALQANRCAWAWFAAHEAAELAARAICPTRNGNAHERMVARLLVYASNHIAVPEELVRKAAVLDSHYIPVQNGHPLTAPKHPVDRSETPFTLGNPNAPESDIAVRTAEEIVAFARTIAGKKG